MKKYYTMAVREDGKWAPQFGAYDLADVQAEKEDYLDHDTLRKDINIITTGDTQAEINAGIAKLNEGN